MTARQKIAFAIVITIVLASCIPAPTPEQTAAASLEVAAKARDDENCLKQNTTCEGYVRCRAAVASRYRQTFTGRCEP